MSLCSENAALSIRSSIAHTVGWISAWSSIHPNPISFHRAGLKVTALSYTTRHGGIPNVYPPSLFLRLCVSLSHYRTRRTKRWQPMCSWIWYEHGNIHLHHWGSLCRSDSYLLSTALSLCPQMDLSLFITTNYFLLYLSYSLTHPFHFCPSPLLIGIQDSLSVCDSGLWALNDLSETGETRM